MKRTALLLALAASAAALAIVPAAQAQTESWSFSFYGGSADNGLATISGQFTTSSTPILVDGVDAYDIESFTGTFSYPLIPASASMSLLPGNAVYPNYLTSPDGNDIYDNLLYPDDNAPSYTTGEPTSSSGYFDFNGVMFYLSPPGYPADSYELSLYDDQSMYLGSEYETNDFSLGPIDELYTYPFFVSVPEGGAPLLYLLLALAACFGAFFFRRRTGLCAAASA
ncbi:MAG: hypothetical protein ACRD3N_00415 [Terracidiphilus sp.]